MPNSIKYSTTGDTQSIRKGNFYFGVGDVGKGPSEISKHYQGISPPTSGYTIYSNTNGSLTTIYCASNNTQLINFTNGFSSQNFTGVTQCLNWYATQTNYVCVNRDYESITTNGLTVLLDAGFTPSYPLSGTSWYDVSYSGNNGSLVNGPVYSGSNGGVLVFDGSDDYVNVSSGGSILSNENYTKLAWFYITNFATSNNIISGGNTGQHAFWTAAGTKLNAGHNGNWSTVVSTTTLSANTWYFGAVTFSTTSGWKLYINGVQESTSVDTTTFVGTGDVQIGRYQTGNNYTGSISNVQIYNRVLSLSEILQNYNAQINRFVPSLVNGSIRFTSTPSQYLSIPNSSAFTQNQAFTIETWFYPTSNTGGYVWAMLQQNFLTVKYSGNKFIIDMSYVGNPPGYSTLNTTYPINNWYHIALTWTGTAGKLFINGVVEWTFTGAGALVNAGNPLLIGQYQGQGQPTPLGYISNFRVVKGTAVYTSAFTPPTSPLTAIAGTQLLLNTYSGVNFLQDGSTNNFTVTNNGSVSGSTFNPF
jgi:energy-coupling factor transporter ATP-binding protein EcfA2